MGTLDEELSGTLDRAGDATVRSLTTDKLNGGVTNQNEVGTITGEHIATQSISSGKISFTSGITSDYNAYALVISNAIPSTDPKNLVAQVATSGTFQTGSDDYRSIVDGLIDSGTAVTFTSTGRQDILLSTSGSEEVGSASGEDGWSGTLILHQPANSNIKTQLEGGGEYFDQGGNLVKVDVGGTHKSAAAVDGVRVQGIGGENLESAEASLLGVMA